MVCNSILANESHQEDVLAEQRESKVTSDNEPFYKAIFPYYKMITKIIGKVRNNKEGWVSCAN